MSSYLVPALVALQELTQDPVPTDEDVVAGWTAFGVFLLLVGAVVLLSFSLVKQLRRAQAAKDAGVYGDEPVAEREPEPAEPASSVD